MAESSARIGIYADDKASAVVTSVQGRLQGLAAAAKSSILTGVGLAGGVAAFAALSRAAGAAIDYLGDAVQAASAMNESQSKAKVVFGASSAEIERWAKGAATNMGMSNQAALEAAGTFGNLFQAMGVIPAASLDMSKGIIQLAADLASFNNASPEDVLIALRAGLVGETEPLRKFGINLSAAAIAAEAVRLGLAETTTQISTSAKAQAAYSLIMQQSTSAQGDFARTSDGLANVQRTLDATMKDVSVEIGQVLLPIMLKLGLFTRDQLIPAVRGLTEAVADAKPVWDALGFAVGKVGDLYGFFTAPVRLAADALGALTGATNNVTPALLGMERGMQTAMKAMEAEVVTGTTSIVKEFEQLPTEMASAMLSREQELVNAATELVEVTKQALTPAQQLAAAIGFLSSSAYANAIASGKPAAIAKATELRNAALAVMSNQAGFYTGGYNISASWVNGLTNALNALKYRATNAMYAYKAMLIGFSPPREGPLKDIDKGAFNIGRAWTKGFAKGIGRPSIPGLSMPGVGRSEGGGGFSGGGFGGGGGAVVIKLEVDGRTLAEIVDRHLYYARPTAGVLGKG